MNTGDEQDDDKQPEEKSSGGAYIPSPEEIAAECAKIRSGWSETRLLRRGQEEDK